MLTYIKAILIALFSIIIATGVIITSPIDYRGKITFVFSKVFSKVILLIAGVRVNTHGKELLDKKENYIFISNHQSYFDIPILMQAVPNNLRFIYRSSLTRIPIFGWGMYLSGYIPINRENPREAIKSLRKASEKIKKGISVVVFPEGTRSTDGELGVFKRGMFVLAEEANVKLVPTSITGSYKILPRNKFKISSGIVNVVFNKPIEYSKDKNFVNEIKETIKSNVKIETQK
ncbi:MAG: 1-acyl-sn-glycerol-3-phosphate acyltransferase [Ignavibacteria bacterium]|nr:1-acyl-sn-glycerol-3-phosphate acyltransferase [Ignavibacteria bacterium]